MKLLKSAWLLKGLALVFAILTYLYIHSEIENAKKKEPDPSYKLIKLTAKSLPVKVRLAAAPLEGFDIVEDQVKAQPERVMVVGPQALLEEADSAETALVDVSDSSKTVTRRIPLESIAGVHVTGQSVDVEVTIPIEKSEPK